LYYQNYNYMNIRNRRKTSDFLSRMINNLSIVLIILIVFIMLKIVKTDTASKLNQYIKYVFYKDYTENLKSVALNRVHSINMPAFKILNKNEFVIDQAPVDGKIVVKFGDNTEDNTTSKGIIYETENAKEVKAIYDGVIEKVEANDKYGLLVTIDHKNGYKSILGYLDEVRFTEGETVKKGEIVGVNGYIPKQKKYGLYFELQLNGICVDPLKYIKLN